MMEAADTEVSDLSGYLRNMAAIDFEVEIGPLLISGVVPTGLRGVLLRNGPNVMRSDGRRRCASSSMLHAFSIDRGEVRYQNRWVNPPEQTRARARRAATSIRPRIDACENVLVHAGRVLVFGESSSPICLADLSINGGCTTFADVSHAPASAHPKIDPMTGEMLLIGQASDSDVPVLKYGLVDSRGRLIRNHDIALPSQVRVHDFALTQRHVVIPVLWLGDDSPHGALEQSLNAPGPSVRVGVLRRDAPVSVLRWLHAPGSWTPHVMNAWENDNRIYVDVMQAPASATYRDAHDAWLCRWTIDLQSSAYEVEREILCDLPGDFPRIDDRYAGSEHRHGWFAASGADGSPFSRLMHIDHVEGRLDNWALPPGCCSSEPLFVPRAPDALEGEGWILAVNFRGDTDQSDLLVFDALNLCDGPVAAAHLPHRVPNGSHGCWMEAGGVNDSVDY